MFTLPSIIRIIKMKNGGWYKRRLKKKLTFIDRVSFSVFSKYQLPLLPCSALSKTPSGYELVYFHISTKRTTIQNSTFLSKNSLSFCLKHDKEHTKIILWPISVLWNVFPHQLREGLKKIVEFSTKRGGGSDWPIFH